MRGNGHVVSLLDRVLAIKNLVEVTKFSWNSSAMREVHLRRYIECVSRETFLRPKRNNFGASDSRRIDSLVSSRTRDRALNHDQEDGRRAPLLLVRFSPPPSGSFVSDSGSRPSLDARHVRLSLPSSDWK